MIDADMLPKGPMVCACGKPATVLQFKPFASYKCDDCKHLLRFACGVGMIDYDRMKDAEAFRLRWFVENLEEYPEEEAQAEAERHEILGIVTDENRGIVALVVLVGGRKLKLLQ